MPFPTHGGDREKRAFAFGGLVDIPIVLCHVWSCSQIGYYHCSPSTGISRMLGMFNKHFREAAFGCIMPRNPQDERGAYAAARRESHEDDPSRPCQGPGSGHRCTKSTPPLPCVAPR